MTLHRMLDHQGRLQARGRAALLAGRVALVGAVLVAVVLLLERMGVDLPFVWMPGAVAGSGPFAKLFGYLAISIAGLAQGILLLAAVFLAAWGIRRGSPLLFRRGPDRIAHDLDGLLQTDRYCAALQARGPLQLLAQAVPAPPENALAPPRPGRLQRTLTLAAALLVLLVALMPGSAGGRRGIAPAPGDDARRDANVTLRLLGARTRIAWEAPVPLRVVLEARAAPDSDLAPALLLTIDDGVPQKTGEVLFIPAGAVGPALEDEVRLDLRVFLKDIAPGEHVAVAWAGRARSNEYRFVIEPPRGDDPKNPRPDPRRKGDPPPPPGPRDSGSHPKMEPKFVEPLVRDGEKVKKRAKVPIEVPGAAPLEKSLKDAWPELQRRREAALNRPGLSPTARKLVREYFERLRPAK